MDYKAEYGKIEALAYAASSVIDQVKPAIYDEETWAKWELAQAALRSYASHVRNHVYNPVLREANERGDYAYFGNQLLDASRGSGDHLHDWCERKGWTEEQVNDALPRIWELAIENGQDIR